MTPFVKLKGKIVTPPWSGTSLSAKYSRFSSLGAIGESLETCPDCGTFDPAYETFDDYLHECGLDVPPLVKLLDTSANLSVQVHPDRIAAARHGGVSKNEFWYVLDAMPDAKMYYGTRDGITRDEVMCGIRSGDILSCLAEISVNKGDVFMIPEGMIHSLGAGITVIEVQNTDGTTYRIKDISGSREIHTEQSCDSFEIYSRDEAASYAISPCGKFSGISLPGDMLVSTLEYAMTRYTAKNVSERLTLGAGGVYVFCENGGFSIGSEVFTQGDSIFIGESGLELDLTENTELLFVI